MTRTASTRAELKRFRKLRPDWHLYLTDWLRKAGVPHVIGIDEDQRQRANSRLEAESWWDGKVLHLAEVPVFGPLDWLYMASHFALAPLERRVTTDFGIPSILNDADVWVPLEHKARRMTIGMAYGAGARVENVFRLTWAWKMTHASTLFTDEDFDGVIQAHLISTDKVIDRCAAAIKEWPIPPLPDLWLRKEINRNAL